MLPSRLKLNNLGAPFDRLQGLSKDPLPDKELAGVSFLRLCEGAKLHIISQIDCRKLVICVDNMAAQAVFDKLSSYEQGDVAYLPPKDEVLIKRRSLSEANTIKRISGLSKFVNGDINTLVISTDSLYQRFPKKSLIKKFSTEIKVEDEISPNKLAEKLVEAGYIRQEVVGDPGEFAQRGDIFDICTIDDKVYRIGFFDDFVEEIRLLNKSNMVTIEKLERILIYPASEYLLDEEGFNSLRGKLLEHKDNENALDVLSMLRVGANSGNITWALPFMDESTTTIMEYFKGSFPALLIFDEPKLIIDKLELLQKEYKGRIKTLLETNEIIEEHKNANYDLLEVKRQFLLQRKMSFSALNLSNPIFEPTKILEPKNKNNIKYYLSPDSLVQDLKGFRASGRKVIVCTGDKERAKGLRDNLQRDEVPCEYSEDGNGDSSVLITPLKIKVGFNYLNKNVVLIGTNECIGKTTEKQSNYHKTMFTVPKAGDYVVHRVHGVGICEGVTRMKSGDYEKEYIVIGYKGGDKLYVSTDQMDNLQKFVGDEHPQLNKIGGKEFEKQKEKTRKSIRKLAIDLLKIYAKREHQVGYKYEPDTIWQREFEDQFPYEETPDQLKAIKDIKDDMESGKIMDRLVVGDVGFGKTEVAFRAMFKTVMGGKQAVLLAPTTILCRQHYENLVDRVKPFGINVKLLTRLQSAQENRTTLEQLKDGTLHMVIASHKILSKNVEFSDLGLLVLDEEQRFGVEHKEKLKEKCPKVNVLTLSATPIPRTLNMALSGVRDISLLETAPIGRLPVDTYVVPFSMSLCVDAINSETNRGGQTLILLNNIEELDHFCQELRANLSDEIRVISAHGQMPPGALEERIAAFYDKQYDVLVSTTIIENGIDLPEANTLIVLNADKFGLSQLYQLRGRVGRRGTLAHAYFSVPSNKEISTIAMKRFNALLENTSIGSGFQIAMNDLAIRGAGTLLGAEQHGHIEKIGYEMYLEMLDHEIQNIKSGGEDLGIEYSNVEMRVDAAAYIQDDYIQGQDKIRIYKQISMVNNYEQRDALIKELTEVYGEVDLPLENLINISLLKNLAKNYLVTKILINKNGAVAYFKDNSILQNQMIMNTIADFKDDVIITFQDVPSLIFQVNKLTPEQKLAKMITFFDAIGK